MGRLPKKGWQKNEKYTKIAKRLIDEYAVNPKGAKFHGVFTSGRLTRVLGKASHYGTTDNIVEQAICLSEKMIRESDEEAVMKVLKHEVAHLEYLNHGKEFKLLCAVMETHGTRVFKDYATYKRGD